MTREELIKWLDDEIIHSAELCEDGDAKSWGYEEGILISRNEAEEIRAYLSFPPAEGAEEITAKKYLSDHGYGSGTNFSSGLVAALMQEFATLHAQRIAEKMVSKRLREDTYMTCDVCGCHPSVIITTSFGKFCQQHAKYI